MGIVLLMGLVCDIQGKQCIDDPDRPFRAKNPVLDCGPFSADPQRTKAMANR
jgi:hypothetical protein